MASRPTRVSICEAAAVVEALNYATSTEQPLDRRVEHMLHRLIDLLEYPALCTIALLDLTQDPDQGAPVIRRYHVGVPDRGEHSQIYLNDNLIAPAVFEVCAAGMRRAHRNTQSIEAFQASAELGAAGWRRCQLFQKTLEPMGYDDAIYAFWTTDPQRMIGTGVYHPVDAPPIDDKQIQLVSLMHRAIAPIIHREMFSEHPVLAAHALTERQGEVLQLLLTGDSEAQIARELHRSVHTVHTHIKQIYHHFNVSSRGELMAQFIDRRALDTTA